LIREPNAIHLPKKKLTNRTQLSSEGLGVAGTGRRLEPLLPISHRTSSEVIRRQHVPSHKPHRVAARGNGRHFPKVPQQFIRQPVKQVKNHQVFRQAIAALLETRRGFTLSKALNVQSVVRMEQFHQFSHWPPVILQMSQPSGRSEITLARRKQSRELSP